MKAIKGAGLFLGDAAPFDRLPAIADWAAGLVEDAFDELARRWMPILDVFDDNGVDIQTTPHAFDDFARSGADRDLNTRLMGLRP